MLVEVGWNLYYCYVIGILMVKVEMLGVGGGLICNVYNGVF